MAQKLKLDALKITQKTGPERNMYIAPVKVRYLLDKSYFQINWWEKEKMGTKKQGYQRHPAEGRKNLIARFIEKNACPIFPANILACSHEEIKFDNKNREIILDDYPVWVVDGQTRIEGFRHALENLKIEDVLEWEMPVVFLSGFPPIDELEQFFVLNSTQKKVSTDLAQRLKLELARDNTERFESVYPGHMWELKALNVVDLLNTKSENPWTGRIRLPNTPKGTTILNQNAFVTSLKPLCKTGILADEKPDEVFKILKTYWNAVRRIFPGTFDTPREYVIQKTPGVFSLHSLANTVLTKAIKDKVELSEYNLTRLLSKCFDENIKDDFWRSGKDKGASRYGSMKGFAILADSFKANFGENE